MTNVNSPGIVLVGVLVIGITLFLGSLKRDNVKIVLACVVIVVILYLAWNSFQAQFSGLPPFKILP